MNRAHLPFVHGYCSVENLSSLIGTFLFDPTAAPTVENGGLLSCVPDGTKTASHLDVMTLGIIRERLCWLIKSIPRFIAHHPPEQHRDHDEQTASQDRPVEFRLSGRRFPGDRGQAVGVRFGRQLDF